MVIITLAGQSLRFKNSGYTQVKYKLDYLGRPIIENILRFIPRETSLLIILNKKFGDEIYLNNILVSLGFENTDIVELEDTAGQLITLHEGLIKTKLNIPQNEPVTVYNGDTIRLSNYWDLTENINAIEVFEAEGDHWSFVDKLGEVSIVREKERISNLCSTGLYHFKNVNFLLYHIPRYLKNAKRQKEFYIAPFYDYLISLQLGVFSYLNSKDNFILCGTPSEYELSLRLLDTKVPFTSRFRSRNEIELVTESLKQEKLSGNNYFGNKITEYFKDRFNFNSFLTPSATAAMEMICDIIPFSEGDEVIIPSYTFVSSALPFTRKGWKVVFCDSREDHPNLDLEHAKSLVNQKTRALVIVNYGGLFFQEEDLEFFKEKNILIIEDAAQSIGSFIYQNENQKKYFGSLGDLAIMSFHYTKNIGCGEGGLLIVNNNNFLEQAYIAQEKGTNRTNFLKGKSDKYRWIGMGSSYLLNELSASLLLSQLINLDVITNKRVSVLDHYWSNIEDSHLFKKQPVFNKIYNNGHLFYLEFKSNVVRENFQFFMKSKGIECNPHYQCLHKSPFAHQFLSQESLKSLPNAEKFEQNLIRLPVHTNLTNDQLISITDSINEYSKKPGSLHNN